MGLVEQLRQWFERDIQYSSWERDVEVHSSGSTENVDEACFRIYTETNRYSISAHTRKDGSAYLGCIAQSRKPRAGETWNRGNDLPDGPFSEETWRRILGAIVGYELVGVQRPKREVGFYMPEGIKTGEVAVAPGTPDEVHVGVNAAIESIRRNQEVIS